MGWAAIFGRVLVGYLDAHEDVFRSTDLIVASPGFGERRHTEEVLRRASIEAGGRWPFDLGDPPAIIKTHAASPLVGRSWHERREIAEGELRRSLDVPDASRVRGKDIIVFDDVFTEGFTIREVARCLSEAGASAVSEIVLARQPYR